MTLTHCFPVFLAAACRVGGVAPDGGPTASQCPAPSVIAACDGTTGLEAPLAVCSPASPCTVAGSSITTEINVPTCTPAGATVPDDRRHWQDANGDDRYACVFRPQVTGLRPLLVFFHGSHGGADDVYQHTLLRDKAGSTDLGDGPGFVLASMQGRNLHWFGPNPAGTHHDNLFREVTTDSCNPDVRSADDLIDTLVQEGGIDTSRIYVAGWSNGAFFAQMYALGRHSVPSPGGNKIAAAVAYAGANPYANIDVNQTPSCQLSPFPHGAAPLYVIHRDCDVIVPCNSTQAGPQTPPGFDVETWVGIASGAVADPVVTDVIVDANGTQQTSCAASCGLTQGSLNHLRWPDGTGNDGTVDWEPAMLDFLRLHPQ